MTTDVDAAAEQGRYEAVLAADPSVPEGREALIRALHDSSWRVRKAAADRIARARDAQTLVAPLLSVLQEGGETGARNAAAEALVRIGRPAVSALIALLAHPDPDQRRFAADILGPIGSREAEQPLIRALEDPDPNVRVSAAEALGRVGGASAPRALEQALGSGDALLELAALEALMRLEVPPALPTLVALSRKTVARRAVTRSFGLVRQPVALTEIGRALFSDSSAIREAALGAIGLQIRRAPPEWLREVERALRPALQKREPQVPGWLEEGLDSEDVEAVRGALFCEGLLSGAERARRIAEAAEDERVAEDALRALVRRGPAAARALAGELETLSAAARIVAAEALVQLSEPSLVPELTALTQSTEPELRLFAIKALGRAQSPAAMAPLVAMFDDPELSSAAGRALVGLARSYPDEARAALAASIAEAPTPAALRALAATGGPQVLPQLRRASRDPDPALRAAAAEAAGEIGGEGAADLLRYALSDESMEVRVAAAGALGRLRAEDAEPLIQIALSDRDAAVVSAAIDAAAESHCAQFRPKLAVLVRAPDGQTAGRAVRALSRLGLFDANALYGAAAHPDPAVVAEALEAGAALPEGVPLAIRFLRHPRWEIRAAAARVLGSSAGPDALTELTAAQDREQDALVRNAMEAARAQLSRR